MSSTQRMVAVDTTATKWFKIIVAIATLFFIGFTGANIYYYNKIRSNPSACSAVTKGEATSMLWINIILLIIAIIIFFWAFVTLFTSRELRQQVAGYFKEEPKGFLQGQENYNPQYLPKPTVSGSFYGPGSNQGTQEGERARNNVSG